MNAPSNNCSRAGLFAGSPGEAAQQGKSSYQVASDLAESEFRKGRMPVVGAPKPGDPIQESITDLLATEPFRRENETVNQIVARTGLYLEFRVWPRERIAAHIAEIERQAKDYPEPKLAPNCI